MSRFDIHLLGYCDSITQQLSKALGWSNDDIPTLTPKAGPLAWQWFFPGAIEHSFESSSESEDSNSSGDERTDEEEAETSGELPKAQIADRIELDRSLIEGDGSADHDQPGFIK